MPPAINMIGQRFNRLLVIKRIGKDKNNNATWLCRCDCGNNKIAARTHLIHSNLKSCGCLYRRNLMNQRVGRLVVVERLGAKRVGKESKIFWRCQCDCGKGKILDTYSLASARTKSCGCLAM